MAINHNGLDHIVGLCYNPPDYNTNPSVSVYRRQLKTVAASERLDDFYPWFLVHCNGEKELVSLESSLKGMHTHEIRSLDSDSYNGMTYNTLVSFNTWTDMKKAHDELSDRFIPDKRYDLLTQYMLLSGQKMYLGMEFNDLRRTQISIGDENDIYAIYVKSGDEKIQVFNDRSIGNRLSGLEEYIKNKDPDVIEAWDIGEVFSLLYEMARQAGVADLHLGRSGLPVYYNKNKIDPRSDIPGRETIALNEAVRHLNSDLKFLRSVRYNEVMEYFGIATGPVAFEVEQLSMLSPFILKSSFELAKMIPARLQEIATRGTAYLIDTMLYMQYLSTGHTVPMAIESDGKFGPLIQVFEQNKIYRNVFIIDAVAMYPNAIIKARLKPENDYLDVFIPMLQKFMKQRADFIELRENCDHGTLEWKLWQLMQKIYKKILVAHYGLEASGGYYDYHFVDRQTAGLIVQKGKEYMIEIKKAIENVMPDAKFLAVMTDAWHCCLDGLLSDDLKGLKDRINEMLGDKVSVSVDGPWIAVYYANNQYALYNPATREVKLKGGALRSKDLPPIIIRLNEEFIRIKLGSPQEQHLKQIKELYDNVRYQIEDFNPFMTRGELVLADLTLEDLCTADGEAETKSPHMQALTRAPDNVKKFIQPGDIVSYYIAKNNNGNGENRRKRNLNERTEVIARAGKIPIDKDFYIELLQKKIRYIFPEIDRLGWKFIIEGAQALF